MNDPTVRQQIVNLQPVCCLQPACCRRTLAPHTLDRSNLWEVPQTQHQLHLGPDHTHEHTRSTPKCLLPPAWPPACCRRTLAAHTLDRSNLREVPRISLPLHLAPHCTHGHKRSTPKRRQMLWWWWSREMCLGASNRLKSPKSRAAPPLALPWYA